MQAKQESTKREAPIIFSTPMVQAILQGKKSQTRRLVEPRLHKIVEANHGDAKGQRYLSLYSPYQTGSVLWIRETWAGYPGEYLYRASCSAATRPPGGRWKPAIQMPRQACRLRLEITHVRAEHLQDISPAGAIAEGIESEDELYRDYGAAPNIRLFNTPDPVQSFKSLWVSIHNPKAWDKNPWVWAIEFRPLT